MKAQRVELLIGKYLEGAASLKEMKQLDQWYGSFDTKTDCYFPDAEARQQVEQRFLELKIKLGIL